MSKKPKGNGKKMQHRDMPATVGLVNDVRDELIARIDGVKEELKGDIHQVAAELHHVKGNVHQVLTAVHRTQALMEEQRSENRIVLNGLKTVLERQDRMDGELVLIRNDIRALGVSPA